MLPGHRPLLDMEDVKSAFLTTTGCTLLSCLGDDSCAYTMPIGTGVERDLLPRITSKHATRKLERVLRSGAINGRMSLKNLRKTLALSAKALSTRW